jgi:Domain of unknown function (DUF4399)
MMTAPGTANGALRLPPLLARRGAFMKPYLSYPAFAAVFLLASCGPMKSAPEQAVFFVQPKDGATVTSPFKVVFGIKGMAVEPAGDVKADSGHHHLLINLDAIRAGDAIPVDATHLHFGKAQTEAEVTLPPGQYKLTMQFANGAHVSYGPAMAASISVTVK